jgi:SHS2 domain-containing protein
MKKYEILEHKADLKIRAFGKTKEELFLNMLLGMKESQKAEVVLEKVKREIKIKSLNLEILLVDFLSEVLYLIQVNKEIYNSIKFKKFTDPSTGSGQAEIEGELIGQKVERFGEDIKAVTYHGLEIRQRKDGTWEATVLFDI